MGEPDDDLRDFVGRWYAAFERGDAGAMAELYAPDARLYLANLPAFRGRPAAQGLIAAMVGHSEMTCRHEVTEIDLRSDRIAVIAGFGWVTARPRDGGEAVREASRFLMVLERDGPGAPWLCVYDMSQPTPDAAWPKDAPQG